MKRLAGAVLLAGLVACGQTPEATGRLVVAVSIPPQAWLVEQIGGPRVTVLTVVPPGSSPDTYQPADLQVSEVMAARVYLRIGVPFEQGVWFEALRSAGQVRIVDQRQGIPLRRLEEHGQAPAAGEPGTVLSGGDEAGGDGDDPHIWLSPPLLRILARQVADLLSELDPGGRAEYQARLATLDGRLSALHAELSQRLQPLAGRSFMVFHPAWGYFAETYGLHQVAIEVEGKQPSDVELTAVQRQALAQGLKVVFVQPQITGKAAAAVAAAIGGHTDILDPLKPDVIANLRQVAQKLVESYQPL